MLKAVIDVGSNSLLLTVGLVQGTEFQAKFESSVVTGLGEGTKETGRLSEQGAANTLVALRDAFLKAESLGSVCTRAFGTMALRIATDSEEFLDRCSAQQTPVRVISGDEEARLGLECVTGDRLFSDEAQVTMIDPGGHSTEIAVATRTKVGWREEFRSSFPIGTLALRGGALADESPGPGALLLASTKLDRELMAAEAPVGVGPLVCLGATGTNLVTLRERMCEWNPESVHGATLDYEEISKAVGWLGSMTDAQREVTPGMERGRGRTIHIGALILERAMHKFQQEKCVVSVKGWRHAMLANI